jgi:hypothetical protein
MNPHVLSGFLLLLSAGFFIVGVFLLFGNAWALIAAGFACAGFAFLLQRGLAHG